MAPKLPISSELTARSTRLTRPLWSEEPGAAKCSTYTGFLSVFPTLKVRLIPQPVFYPPLTTAMIFLRT